MADIKKHINSPLFILGPQYFLYFGVLGIFLPFFNLYCYHIGFSGFQIGVLSAVRTLSTVVFPLLWGAAADRYQIRKPIYIFCNAVSSAVWASLLYTSDFYAMLVICALYGIFYSPIISFLEAITMDALGREKKRYGRIRVWGSVNFVIVVVLLGRLIDIYSIEIIIFMILIGSVLQAGLSFRIPDVAPAQHSPFRPGVRQVLKPRLIIFLLAAFLMLVSHGTYYGFFSIHLENLGYDKTFIGLAWALASVAEILVMIRSDALLKNTAIEKILIFSFVVAACRWALLFFTQSASVILFSQVLHAVTYGAFHIASILYVDKLIPAEAKTFGQAVNNAVTYGLGLTAGFMFNGILFEQTGSSSLFLISSLTALLGGGLLTLSLIKRDTQ